MAVDIAAYGASLAITLSSVVTTIPQVHEISWDGFKVSERNPTHLGSSNKRKKPGLPDFGEIKFKCWYDPNDTTHIAFRDLVKTPSQTASTFTLTYNDSYATHAKAVVTGYPMGFNQTGFKAEDGTIEYEGMIPVDGITSFNIGTA